jgi:hypothetical protein
MPDNPNAFHINVILFEHGEWWSAQCLEYDIAAQAKSLSDLLYELERVLVSHLYIAEELGRQPFDGLGPAPQKFWDLYDRTHTRIEADNVPFRLPHPTAISPVAPRLKVADSRELCSA